MNSTVTTQPRGSRRPASEPALRCYMVDCEIDRFRWIAPQTRAEGSRLAQVGLVPVSATWKPVSVEWARGTKRRPICDFPIFYSIVRCFSRRALEALSPYTEGALEALPLDGLDDAYVAVHCIRWLDCAANFTGVDQDRISIFSVNFVPRLNAEAVADHDLFGVPEIRTKLFVSEHFKNAVERNGLIGLQFREVELC